VELSVVAERGKEGLDGRGDSIRWERMREGEEGCEVCRGDVPDLEEFETERADQIEIDPGKG
jgi:hypothetical protein